jgi:hypothetical protein
MANISSVRAVAHLFQVNRNGNSTFIKCSVLVVDTSSVLVVDTCYVLVFDTCLLRWVLLILAMYI